MEIQGFSDYLIYEDGRVQNKKTKRFLKPGLGGNGYWCVSLRNNKKASTKTIYRLIAVHYIPNPENKKEVDHINRIRTDDRIENLRWTTRTENQQNRSLNKNNKLNIPNICYHKQSDSYAYKKTINKKKNQKYFKTLEEAIQYKEQYEKTLQVQ